MIIGSQTLRFTLLDMRIQHNMMIDNTNTTACTRLSTVGCSFHWQTGKCSAAWVKNHLTRTTVYTTQSTNYRRGGQKTHTICQITEQDGHVKSAWRLLQFSRPANHWLFLTPPQPPFAEFPQLNVQHLEMLCCLSASTASLCCRSLVQPALTEGHI